MKIIRFILYPIAFLYGGLMTLRNFFYDIGFFSSKIHDFPVISVGNLSMGGTGKSPHVEYIIRLLKRKSKIATLSRGYGRNTTGFLEVSRNHSFLDVGDEPKVFKDNYPYLNVFVDANRNRGIRTIREKYPETKCVIMDDAFQHRTIKPGLSILLTDYSKLYIKDLMLPTGGLREPHWGAQRADIIVVTKCPPIFSPVDARAIRKQLKAKPYQKVYFSYLSYNNIKPVYKNEHPKSIKLGKESDILLFTGIAKPSILEYHLKDKVNSIRHLRFGDHHNFMINDIQKIVKEFEQLKGKNKIILTTEKDSVRLQSSGIKEILGGKPIYFIPVQVQFHGKDKDEFDEQILEYVARNK